MPIPVGTYNPNMLYPSQSHSVVPAPLPQPQTMPPMMPQIYHVPGHIRPETLPPNAQVVHLSGHHHRRHHSHGHERDPRQETMVQPPPQVQPQPYQAPASYQLPNDGFLDGDHERYSRYPQVVHSEPPQHQPESRQRPYPRDDEYERRHGHHGYYGDRHDDRPRPQPEFGSSHSHNGGGHQPQQQQYSHQQDSHSPRPSSMNFRPSHNGSAGGLGEMAANFASGVLNNYVQGHSPRPHSFHNSPRPNNPSYPMNNGSGVYQGGIGGTEHAPPPGQLGLGDIASAFHGGSAAGNLEAMGQAIVDAYRYSRCTGRKKAVCIGINYIGSSNELKGCINDAWHVRDFLVDSHGFKAQDILMLTDDAPDPSIDTRSMNSRSRSKNNSRDLSRSQFRALNSRSKVQKPTKENILQAMKWLVGSPKQDDSLFFHYSGHGGRTPDVHGDEADGYDEGEFILLLQLPMLLTTMHEIMMKCLPEGCRLTTLFDCCHSGTILDYDSSASMALSPSTLPNLTNCVTKQGSYPAAHGGFADIWLCTLNDKSYEPSTQNVAVKVLRSFCSAGVESEKKYQKRLRRELAVWLMLKHPQVLPLYGIVSDFGPYPSMVCPWMEKGNLNDYLVGAEGKSLNLQDRHKILQQVCAGLAYLHSRSVVHGDLTGCNILISGSGNACLSDFGLSTMITDLQGGASATSSIGGNVRYAAPELYRLNGDDARTFPTVHSDIYSLGSIILQTLTGMLPYHYLRIDGQVLIELSRGVPPHRPQDPIITDSRWRLLCACWEGHPPSRPALQAVIEYLADPDAILHPRSPALPHLTNIQLDSIVNVSHARNTECWKAPYAGDVVIVKVFRLPVDKDLVLREVRTIGELRHQYLVPYVATMEDEGSVGFIMPLITGQSLRAYLQNISLSFDWKLTLVQQIACGLLHLHSMSVVHGGLNAWNILVTDNGRVKLSSFGVMPILYRHIESSKILATYGEDWRWADPILWFGYTDDQARPCETFATDVYSFGSVVYQIMTNRKPFQDVWDGNEEGFQPLLEGYTFATFRPPRLEKRAVSEDIWELIESCWVVDHQQRPDMQLVSSRIRFSVTSLSPVALFQ
ncbi:hypothetical protein EYR40_001964 [Pleurotus pulmonarius]|nr:hypothetical protein EYR40_001964 [Pleurotus pulmonarius]